MWLGYNNNRKGEDSIGYWIRDRDGNFESHSLSEDFVIDLIKEDRFTEGNTMDNGLIVIHQLFFKKIEKEILTIQTPISITSSLNPIMIKIWSHYRSLIIREDCEEEIKRCAKRLKLKISLYGIKRLYDEIIETENLKSLGKQFNLLEPSS